MPFKHTTKLQGKHVLIIGGTSGIGFAVTEHLLELGATVVVASSRQSSVDRTLDRVFTEYSDLPKTTLRGTTIDLLHGNADTDLDSALVQLLNFATDNKAHLLDHIVTTAGEFPDTVPIAELELPGSSFLTAQRTRLLSPLILAKHAKTYMHDSPRSSLTMTGGANTHRPAPNWYLQAAAGGGLEALSRSLAVELRPIRVNTIAPGPVWTELFGNLTDGSKEAEGEMRQSWKNKTLTGQMAEAHDCAEAYIYVIRDASVTGQTIYNESGYLLSSAVS